MLEFVGGEGSIAARVGGVKQVVRISGALSGLGFGELGTGEFAVTVDVECLETLLDSVYGLVSLCQRTVALRAGTAYDYQGGKW